MTGAAGGREPRGPLVAAAVVLALTVAAAVLAWVWTGDHRWGGTGCVLSVLAFALLGLSMRDRHGGPE